MGSDSEECFLLGQMAGDGEGSSSWQQEDSLGSCLGFAPSLILEQHLSCSGW